MAADGKPNGQLSVSVVTAAYNRSRELERLWDSLCKQTFRDFEWVLVDDGSNDDTAAAAAGWAQRAEFPLRLIQQPNRGRQVALNRGVEQAHGRFCAVIDSDDWFVDDALERLLDHWDSIPGPEQESFANVEALSAYADGKLVGTRFPADVFDSDFLELRYRRNRHGDTIGMYRREVLARFPFPEDLRYGADGLLPLRVAREYRTRYVNEVLAHRAYTPGGLTDRKRSDYVASAAAYRLYNQELAHVEGRLPAKVRLRAYANATRYGLHEGVSPGRQLGEARSKPLWALTLPAGLLLHRRDLREMQAE